jgi:2'-5' RNA ligase
MDLVRAAGEGGGANDWAEELIGEMGEEGKRALLERLKDSKAKKHYFTIARLLLSLFPSPESKKAVKRSVERESNEELKRLYVVLLATAQKMNPEEIA